MREILFRGKTNKTLINGTPHHTNKGAWVEGSLTVSYDGSICTISGRQSVYTVHKETVGQFTGLNDKNDTRVFEGDVCVHFDKGNYPRPLVVEWVEECACFSFVDVNDYHKNYFFQKQDMGDIEVIGNIHNNKYLLK